MGTRPTARNCPRVPALTPAAVPHRQRVLFPEMTGQAACCVLCGPFYSKKEVALARRKLEVIARVSPYSPPSAAASQ